MIGLLYRRIDMSDWISVEEAMPPLDKTVLICWSDSPDIEPEKDFLICWSSLSDIEPEKDCLICDEGCPLRDWANFGGCHPTHWMPLPEPPQ